MRPAIPMPLSVSSLPEISLYLLPRGYNEERTWMRSPAPALSFATMLMKRMSFSFQPNNYRAISLHIHLKL